MMAHEMHSGLWLEHFMERKWKSKTSAGANNLCTGNGRNCALCALVPASVKPVLLCVAFGM